MFLKDLPDTADIVIIGGGVIGCSIARELSRYKLNIVLLEKNPDIAWGTTKANLGMVHAFVTPIKSLKGKLCLKGNEMFDELSKQLDVEFNRPGLILVALTHRQNLMRFVVYIWAKKNKIPVKWISRKWLLKEEPNINRHVKGGLLFPTAGIISPYEFTIALAENAIENGVKIYLDTEVKNINKDQGGLEVETNRGKIKTKYVINAAGVYADKIANMVGIDNFKIYPRSGTMLIFDKQLKGHYKHIYSLIPAKVDPRTKGGGAAFTTEGNLIWGPNLREINDKEDRSVTREDIELVFKKFSQIFPSVRKKDIIRFFAGIRAAANGGDFIIGTTKVKGFINVAGIQSPGLTASPAIAKMIVEILKRDGLEMPEKRFIPTRKRITRFAEATIEEKSRLIEMNPKYGHIICRCEYVSEAEIIEAIKRGATTIDGIKFRTRAGMGRCQGGFCTTRIIEILSRELKMDPLNIRKNSKESYVLCCETKSLRRN